MDTAALQRQILEEKKRTGTLVLAHTYQSPDIIDIADITGDSYALSVAATRETARRVLVCGVRFMGETVKILSPEKEVLLPSADATCPMAEQIKPEAVAAYKKEHPDTTVVAYINTTAALKTVCDVCVTSSSALKIVRALPGKDILFIPDRNLGGWIRSQVPEKNFTIWDGCCPVHDSLTESDVLEALAAHPGAKLAVHPECRAEVVRHASYTGATTGIIQYALNEPGEILIGTERGVADYLIPHHPARTFHYLCPDKLVCPDMKMITLENILAALRGEGGEVLEMDELTRQKAKVSLDNMLKYGG